MNKEKIIIVGAGAAGLYAASMLAEKFDIIVLEAREVMGGRIRSLREAGFSSPVEAGAEFVHGNLPITLELLKQAGIQYTAIEGKMYRSMAGKLEQENEFFEHWDTVLNEMKELREDMVLNDFLDTYLATDDRAAVRKQIISYAGGFDLADPAKVSVKSLYREWSAEDEDNFRVIGGYSQLTDHLIKYAEEKAVVLYTGHVVTDINWSRKKVQVETAGGKQFCANKVLVTVPGNLLATQSINISPLPMEYLKALEKIGFGTVIKVVIEFHSALWEKDAGFIFSNEVVPTWWTALPDRTPQLTGWLGGTLALAFADSSDEELWQAALQSLANIFNATVDDIKKQVRSSRVYRWQKEPFARGAYSYATPESPAALEVLNRPIDDTIYFAGESFYRGDHPGTVEAALENGKEAALRIIANTH